MKKQLLLTLLAVIVMTSMATASAKESDVDDQTYQQSVQETAPAICYVAGHFHLTPAEALRRIGSWTHAASASNECPSAVAHKPYRVGFIPNAW
jgi:hypothetical protein